MYGNGRFSRKNRMSPIKRAFIAGLKAGKRQVYRQKKKSSKRWH